MKGAIGIKEVIYLVIGMLIIVLILIFLGSFSDIKDGLVEFFRGNNPLERFK